MKVWALLFAGFLMVALVLAVYVAIHGMAVVEGLSVLF